MTLLKLRSPRILLAGLALAPGFALADPPMVSDDAGTLDRGTFKLEAQWSRQGAVRETSFAFGYAPINALELEVSLARQRDTSITPDEHLRATGFVAKWVPLEFGRTTMGLKLEYGDSRNEGGLLEGTTQVLGLLTHRYEAGHAAHFNLGQIWVRPAGAGGTSSTVWALGASITMTPKIDLVGDLYGDSTTPDTGWQVGVRLRAMEGLTLGLAAGRQGSDATRRLVASWEF